MSHPKIIPKLINLAHNIRDLIHFHILHTLIRANQPIIPSITSLWGNSKICVRSRSSEGVLSLRRDHE